jgi:hypothetical protein
MGGLMKKRNDRWEVSGSLTPELEGTPRSFSHQKRTSLPKSKSRDPSNVKAKKEHPEIPD